MDYKEINEVLSDLEALRKNKVQKDAGESDEVRYEICRTNFHNLFVKLKVTINSYSDKAEIIGIEFVTPSEKTVISYEPLK